MFNFWEYAAQPSSNGWIALGFKEGGKGFSPLGFGGAMDFWGLAIPPSKHVVGKASKSLYIHVSNAALADVKIPSENERVVLRVKIKNDEFVLGTLIPGKCDQLNLDVIYNTPFIVSHNSKSCSVHLTGYTTEAMEDMTMTDEDLDDIVDATIAKELEPKSKAKKMVRVVKSESDDDDEDDDDDGDESDDSDLPVGLPVHRFMGESDDDEDDDDDDEDDSDDDEDDSDDDEDESDDDEEDESDEELKVPNESLKRKIKPSPGASPAEKKIKTPSGKGVKADSNGKADVKPEVKAEVKTPTAKTPKQEEKKSDKKSKATPKSAEKPKGTPGSKHYCEPCARNFSNEGALIQHNSAKHK